MGLGEFLALIRAGKIRISMHYEARTGKVVCRRTYPEGLPADVIDETTEVLRNNQGKIFYLVRNNDIRVCYDVVGHEPHHKPAMQGDGESVTVCEECERIRELDRATDEELLLNPPIDFKDV